MIAVTNAERFRSGSRLTFVCGARALRSFRTYRDAVAGAVRVLSVLPHELPGAIERTQVEVKEGRKAVSRLQGMLAGHEAARLLSEASTRDGVRIVTQSVEGWDAAGLKAIATALTAQSDIAAVLVSSSAPAAIVVARSPNVGLDASKMLRALLDRFGGRGGGRPDLAQGAGLAGRADDILAFARELIGSG
jgi:alanyl-tRNA synthetase